MTINASSARSDRGFTLAELLVTCAIIGVVMGGLFSVLVSGQQTYLSGTNQVQAQQELRLMIGRMSNEIRNAGYCPTCGTGTPPIAAFSAITAASSTGFTIQNDWDGSWDGAAGISAAAVTYNIVGSDGTPVPVQRGEQILYAFNAGTLTRREMGLDASAQPLAGGLASLSFSYLDATGAALTGNPITTPANIRTVVINVVGQPTGPSTFQSGKVQVPMTASVRVRNRAL
jgi:prepilin-type N-terminal cleavage/methylation domain-containing protein